MKNLFYIMVGLALCATAASCSSDDDAMSAPKTLSATATIGNSNTRTSYVDQGTNGMKVNWKDSEAFKAYYTEGGITPLIFNKTDGNAFVATDVPDGISTSTAFTGVYGKNVTYNPETGKYTVDYRNQNGKLGSLANYDAMIAASTTDASGLHFPFKHLSSFVKVTLKRGSQSQTSSSTDAGRKRFSITFDECQLSDENMDVVGWSSRNGSFTINFKLDTSLALNEERIIYLAVPPITGYNGKYPMVEIQEEGYSKIVSMKSYKLTFEAGKVYETSITYYTGTYTGGWG